MFQHLYLAIFLGMSLIIGVLCGLMALSGKLTSKLGPGW